MIVPEDFTDFLYWFKEQTEFSWNIESKLVEEDKWLLGAKWIGLEEYQIDQIETKFQIKFTPDHREFLKILHTVNVKDESEHQSFFDWLEDENKIKDTLNYPYDTLLQDKIWLKSWGEKPDSDEEKKIRFNDWYDIAPKLIPIYSHRYIISEPLKVGNPVLSIFGTDTIIYGWNLRSYLFSEFRHFMSDDLFQSKYDDEDATWYSEYKDEIQDIFDNDWLNSSYDMLPHWGELIEYYEGDWKYQPRIKK
jgi:hypothetical protein